MRAQYALFRHHISGDAPEEIAKPQFLWAKGHLENLANNGDEYAQLALGSYYTGYLDGHKDYYKVFGNWPDEALKWLEMINSESDVYPEAKKLIMRNRETISRRDKQ